MIRFLGMEFKFCTDRRMTAHVLSTKPPSPHTLMDNVKDFTIDKGLINDKSRKKMLKQKKSQPVFGKSNIHNIFV